MSKSKAIAASEASVPSAAPPRPKPSRGKAKPAPGDVHQDKAQAVPERLLSAAIRIFAAKGYAKASTREICVAAGANIAAIHYYYGGKEGLYQAVLTKPVNDVVRQIPCDDVQAVPPMDVALRDFYRAFLSPLIHGGDVFADLRRVTLREMVEPTPAFAELVHKSIAPEHEQLVQMLALYCLAPGPGEAPHAAPLPIDNALHQLAFALVAVVENYWMSIDYMRMLAPGMLDSPQAYEQLLDRLVGYGMAMVDHERSLRHASNSVQAAKSAPAVKKRSNANRK